MCPIPIDSDEVRHAALFPHEDLPDPPAGHPFTVIHKDGYDIGVFAGATFGTVMVSALRPEAINEAIEETRSLFRENGIVRGAWLIANEARPADLALRLLRAGLVPSDEPPFEERASAMALTEPPEPGPADVEARLPRTFEEFVGARRIADDAFESSDRDRQAFETQSRVLWDLEQIGGTYRTFVAFLDGEAVAFAAAVLGRHAVYLAGGATRPEARGRGAYRALIRARWEVAVRRDTPALTVTAGTMSRPILERSGFQTVGWVDCLLDKFD